MFLLLFQHDLKNFLISLPKITIDLINFAQNVFMFQLNFMHLIKKEKKIDFRRTWQFFKSFAPTDPFSPGWSHLHTCKTTINTEKTKQKQISLQIVKIKNRRKHYKDYYYWKLSFVPVSNVLMYTPKKNANQHKIQSSKYMYLSPRTLII